MKNKSKRLIFVNISIILSVLLTLFIVQNFREQIIFFYSPSELKEALKSNKISDKKIRVGGLVVKDSVIKNGLVIEFKISDGANNLKIVHKGLTPDLFREGQGVVAKGKYNKKQNIFFSSELLVKHDENYMPPEVSSSIKHELKNKSSY